MSKDEYLESHEIGRAYRTQYLKGIMGYVDTVLCDAARKRDTYADGIFTRPDEYREALAKMLGHPLNGVYPNAKLLEKTFIAEIDGCDWYRVVTEAVEGVPFYGLLILQKGSGRYPLVISQHGGLGTPELCSSLYEGGSGNYNDMTRRLLKYKVNVYAPQLLLWHELDESGKNKMDPLRKSLDTALKASGSSITAVELYSIGCAVSVLSENEKVDSAHIGMTGLSYGGLYTLLMTALDVRIKAAISCSFFGGITGTHATDWNWQNNALLFGDAEIAALCWPRDISLLMGDNDPLFNVKHSCAEYERVKKLAGGLPLQENIHFQIFEGQHEFINDDAPIEHMMRILEAQKLE